MAKLTFDAPETFGARPGEGTTMKAFGRVLVIAGLLIAPSVGLAGPAVDSSAPAGGVISPRDHASGLPTGKRMHKPFTITKEWSSRAAAVSDCTALHGSVGADANGKLVCTGDVDGDGMTDVCARASAMGAMCKP
jgi:hypothetical protein